MSSQSCTVYRVVDSRFTKDEALSGEGSRAVGGRWNQEGTAVVYCSENASLAMLKKLAGITHEARGKDYKLFSIHFVEDSFGGIEKITEAQLPENWREYPAPDATRDLGTRILEREAQGGEKEETNNISIIEVPSVICPLEVNVLLSPFLVKSLDDSAIEERIFTFDERVI